LSKCLLLAPSCHSMTLVAEVIAQKIQAGAKGAHLVQSVLLSSRIISHPGTLVAGVNQIP